MKKQDTEKRKIKAWGITIGIHAVLLLVFLMWKYDFPVIAQPAEVEMLEVALGTDMDGLGEDPDQNMEDPAAAQEEESVEASSNFVPVKTETPKQKIETSDAPDLPNPVKIKKSNPVENKTQKSKENKPTTTNNNTSTSTQAKGKYTMDGGTGKGGNQANENKAGTGSGNTFGNGTKGTPGGSPDGKLYITNPFKDRTFRTQPSPNATYNNGGIVRVRVTINREGVITNSSIITNSSELRILAQQKLKSITFNKAPNAAPQQSGTIIFNFKTGNK